MLYAKKVALLHCFWIVCDMMVLGPGLGTGEAAQYLVDKVLRSFDGTVVLDADGINVLSEHMDLFETMHSKLILTPHLMEMSRLTNQSVTDIKANKYDLAREFANAGFSGNAEQRSGDE